MSDINEKKFQIIIEYDGTAYHGWQRQAEDRTIQAQIETALATMVGSPVTLMGSGRTDAGVHALAQSAHFSCITRIGPEAFKKGLNSLLPPDIVIHACRQVPPAFHARFDAAGKTYRYRIRNHPDPCAVGCQYSWHIRSPLSVDAMNAGARHILGTHDFKAFEGAGSPRSDTRRTIFSAEWTAAPDHEIVFTISGNGFLRFMVRNLVGALTAVGQGKLAPEAIEALLAGEDRRQAPPTAPPHGLFLVKVDYGSERSQKINSDDRGQMADDRKTDEDFGTLYGITCPEADDRR
ncbi:MAG: tRNA pseudouridine(38-40) synthase TruA [Pseudomonadota bacterium]